MIRVEPGKEYITWAKRNTCNHVYPLSIAENRQYGDIFVDNVIDPHSVFFWLYCGFAYLTGEASDTILNEIAEEISVKSKRRMILITDDPSVISFMDSIGCIISKRFEYEYDGMPCVYKKQCGFEVNKIDANNIHSRGQGIASALALRMCEDIFKMGKRPVWAHAESNVGSMRTAFKCGFIQRKINWCCCIRLDH